MRIERVEERRFYEIEATHQDLGQMQMYVNYYDRHMSMQRLTSSIPCDTWETCTASSLLVRLA